MAGISSTTGLISGINIVDTVTQLLKIEARPRDLLISRTTTVSNEQGALSKVTAAILSLQFSAQALGKTSIFNTRTAQTSNSTALSATVTGTPRVGVTQVTPVRTAQAQQYLSSGVSSLTEALSAGSISFSAAPRLDSGIELNRLNGGDGVGPGKIKITDRAGDTATIDLRYATTIDDVLNAINNNDDIDVTATIEGDRIKLTDNTGQTTSNLIVKEVSGGSTAADLGLRDVNVAASSYVGNDIFSLHSGTKLSELRDGAGIRLSSDLDDLTITFRDGTSQNIGLRQTAQPEAAATASTSTSDPKFSITANNAGDAYDGVSVIFQDNGSVTQGSETVVYDDLAKTITVQIDKGSTTAADVISAINNDASAGLYFTAATIDGGTGNGLIDTVDTAITTGGTALSSAVTTAANANASIEISAVNAGGDYDGVQILFVDDPGVSKGSETVIYDDSDPGNKTLTVHIKAGETTADDVIAAISGDPLVSPLFTAANVVGSNGDGLIDVSDTGTTSGGTANAIGISTAQSVDSVVKLTAKQLGGEYDNVTLRYVNDPAVTAGNEVVEYDDSDPDNITLTVRIQQGATTADNVIAAINGNATTSARFTAATATGGSGDRIVDVLSTAVTSGGAAREERSPQSLGDLLTIFNEVDPTRLQAQISADGDRIELIDLSTDNGGSFSVSSFGDGHAAEDLGIAFSTASDTISSGRYIGGLNSKLISSLNGGKGFDLGSIKITDRSGATATIDLSGAETVQDVLTAFNDSGLGIEAEYNTAGNGITIRDTTGQFFSNFKIENADATNSATQLNIAVSTSQTKVESGSLHFQYISEQTELDSLNGGKGITRGKFIIKDSAGGARVFDLSGDTIKTVGDLLNAINSQTGVKVTAEINATGDGIKIIDQANGSGELRIQDSGTTGTATSLGLLGTGSIAQGDSKQSIVGTFNKTIQIEAGETINDVITKINDLDAGFSANVFDYGAGSERYRISLTSDKTGSGGNFQIDSSNSQFEFDETVRGQDALLLFGSNANGSSGILTTSSTNTFTGVVEGLSVTIKEATNTPVNITVSESDTALISAANSFVTQYNALVDLMDDYTSFNEADSSTGILFGTNVANRIDTELGEILTKRYAGLGSIQSLQQLGFTYNDSGKLTLDTTKLQQKFAEDPEAVEEFFLKEQTISGEKKKIGFAQQFDDLMEAFAGANSSLLISRIEALQSKIDLNQSRIDAWNEKLERRQTVLLNQFYDLESTLAKIQTNTQYLSAIQPITIPEN
ncbi:flagellar filament capping protein FliD [Blastopirellula sp. JC732]|uniref:Filament cap protein n=1 Tax=Blastopirellula sediminis TaxID=2894196 RepID=A0A9X1MMM2_9BACT|nr:flagellar filament capping protein FliD [Blastopirellula sediminis]MCC9607662.1 flagellar filament capping protein FliD [Blastopirellula sediminis]MCC9629045.1 flagellar filament capping protein FliD [Blastopirellula sediminis]